MVVIAECSGAATKVCREVDWNIHYQCVCGGVGLCCRVWIWRVGKCDKFRAPDWHIWALHKVFPMPSSNSTTKFSTSSSQCHSTYLSQPHSPSPPLKICCPEHNFCWVSLLKASHMIRITSYLNAMIMLYHCMFGLLETI